MRAICFVQRLEFDFSGNVFQNAVAVGDVNNDGENELVVGNMNGDLAIFKGTNLEPWRKASDLGMITAIGIGDIFNNGKNALVVVCGDGWCYIFVIDPEPKTTSADTTNDISEPLTTSTEKNKDGSELKTTSTDKKKDVSELKTPSTEKQKDVSEPKTPSTDKKKDVPELKTTSIDKKKDGPELKTTNTDKKKDVSELSTASADKKKEVPEPLTISIDKKKDASELPAMSTDKKVDVESSESIDITKLHPVHVQRIPPNTKLLLLGDIDGDGFIELVLGLTDRVVRSYRWAHAGDVVANKLCGKLIGLNKWECANQIGTVTLNHMADGSPTLLVAQPGGTFIRIRYNQKNRNEEIKADSELLSMMSVEYHPLSSSRMRNSSVSTAILGDLEEGPSKDIGKGTPYAVATLDGTLMLVKDEEIVWSIQVDHQLFALTKLDVTGDGKDEIIACSWDGQTYILNLEKQSVRFQLEETVESFCSGYYSLSSTKTVPCFVYTTFNNKIYLYYDVKLPSVVTKSFKKVIDENKELSNLSGVSLSKMDREEFRKFSQWCFYGQVHDN